MSSFNTKFLVPSPLSPLVPISSPFPVLTSPTSLIIRLRAIAINPADIKMIDLGHRGTSYPFVPGLDGSGIIEAVGEGVKDFAPGDEVLALFMAGDRGGSYQEFAVVEEKNVAKMPGGWSFEEATSLGVCYLTALIALGIGLKTPLPFLPGGPMTGFQPSSILVLGGSSALGAAAIQLIQLALPSCSIFATSSPKHFAHLTETLGTDGVFDRNSASLVGDVKLACPRGQGVDAILDAVGAGSVQRNIFDALDPEGPKRYAQVWTGDDEIKVPDGVESIMFRSRDVTKLPGGDNAMLALQMLLEETKYKLPLPVKIVGEGFEALGKALDLMRKGVSGEKLVVAMPKKALMYR